MSYSITVHSMLDAMPGQLVFGQDMLLPIQSKTDWAGMSKDRERTSSCHQTDELKTQTDEQPYTTQDTNCSQSERTRIDKDTTLVN